MNVLFGDDIPNRYNVTDDIALSPPNTTDTTNNNDTTNLNNNNNNKDTTTTSISSEEEQPPSRYDPESMKRIGLDDHQSEEEYMEDVLSSVLDNPNERRKMIQFLNRDAEQQQQQEFHKLGQWTRLKWLIGCGVLVFCIALLSTYFSLSSSPPPSSSVGNKDEFPPPPSVNLSSICSMDSLQTSKGFQDCTNYCSVAKTCCYTSPLLLTFTISKTKSCSNANNNNNNDDDECSIYSTHCLNVWKEADTMTVNQLCSSDEVEQEEECFRVCDVYSCCYNDNIICDEEVVKGGYCDVFGGCNVLLHPFLDGGDDEGMEMLMETTEIMTTTTTELGTFKNNDNDETSALAAPIAINMNEVTAKCPPTLATTSTTTTTTTNNSDKNYFDAIDECRDICTGHMCCVMEHVAEEQCKCHDDDTCQLFAACEVLLHIPTWLPLLEEEEEENCR